jgi:thiamine-phosphate pyrophosphorylase
MPDFDLCVITARAPHLRRGHLDVARAALAGGARLLQLRDKELSSRALWEVAREIVRLARPHRAALIINDRLDIALAVGADGVHLGPHDLPLAEARRLLGPAAIIGASVSTAEEAQAAQEAGATYLGVGPIYPTSTKPDAGEAVGPARIAQIERTVSLPVLAIGGINRDNVGEAIRAGADGVAVISAVAEAQDMTGAVAALLQAVRQARGENSGGAL